MKKERTYKPILDMSLYRFLELFPTDKEAEAYITKLRWRGTITCPHCGSERISHCGVPQPYRCKDCRKHFSVRTNTVLAQSRIPFRKFLLAIYLMTTHKKGIPATQMARELGVTYKTAWYLGHRIRQAWKQEGGLFAGPVEVDETYMGGKERNRHHNAKHNAGRGPVGKTAIVGASSRQDGKVKAQVTEQTTKEALQGFIHDSVQPGEDVYTDDHRSYADMPGFNHESVKHSIHEYVRDKVHTNSIESFWSLLKKAYYGTHHYMSPKHMQLYVDEAVMRFNLRNHVSSTKIAVAVSGCFDKTMTFDKLTS